MTRRRPVFTSILSAVAGILILASGCTESSPIAPQLSAPTALSAARSFAPASYAILVTPAGGTFQFGVGEITFPAGAVTEPTNFTASVDGQTLSVAFQPHFDFPTNAQPRLSLSFQDLRVNPAKLVVYHISDSGELKAKIKPTVGASRATIDVTGFSRFVLADN